MATEYPVHDRLRDWLIAHLEDALRETRGPETIIIRGQEQGWVECVGSDGIVVSILIAETADSKTLVFRIPGAPAVETPHPFDVGRWLA